jgi:hypothetical protein
MSSTLATARRDASDFLCHWATYRARWHDPVPCILDGSTDPFTGPRLRLEARAALRDLRPWYGRSNGAPVNYA